MVERPGVGENPTSQSLRRRQSRGLIRYTGGPRQSLAAAGLGAAAALFVTRDRACFELVRRLLPAPNVALNIWHSVHCGSA
jgi:hypothetical protein